MKPLYLAWLLFTTVTTAFDLASLQKLLPECSLLCLADGVMKHNCTLDDFECQCNNIEPIIKTVSPCLVKAGCTLQNITSTFFPFRLRVGLVRNRNVLTVCSYWTGCARRLQDVAWRE